MSRKPLIGITKPDNEALLEFSAFWAAIKLAGGEPVQLSAGNSDHYKTTHIDGLLLGGGKDVFPGLYNDTPKKEYVYDRKRDEMEIFWAERAREENIPVLGICRGAQLLNIVCVGSLHASVAEAYEDAHYPDGFFHNAFYRKKIKIEPGTLLHKIMPCQALRVNSIHKQAIAEIGKDLEINAQESNGVVQAIAHTAHPFFLGVQFHPEFLIYRRIFRQLFEAFVAKANERSEKDHA